LGCGDVQDNVTITATPAYTSGKIGKCLTTGGFNWSGEQTQKMLNNKAFTYCC
jgi:hypothetical protein